MKIVLGAVAGSLLGAAAGGLAGLLFAFLVPPSGEADLPGLEFIIFPMMSAAGGATLGFVLGGGLAARNEKGPEE